MDGFGAIRFVQMMTVSIDSSDATDPILIEHSRSLPAGVELGDANQDVRNLLEGQPDGEYNVWIYAESRWWREATMAGTEVESEDEILDYIIEKHNPDDYEIQLVDQGE